jgi:hypothetical protein
MTHTAAPHDASIGLYANARPNKFGGACHTCSRYVPKMAGILTGSKADGYILRHQPGQCETAAPAIPATAATPEGETYRPNKFPGKCTTCGETVPAGEGKIAKAGKTWTVSHLPGTCEAPAKPAPAPKPVHAAPVPSVTFTSVMSPKAYVKPTVKVEGPGVFKHGSDIVVIRWVKKYGGKRLAAFRLVESAPRVTLAGTVIPFSLVKSYGLLYSVTEAERMTLADANEISAKVAQCICCGKTLYAADTIKKCKATGIWVGPDCRETYFPATVHTKALVV